MEPVSFVVTSDQSRRFGEISGDCNPLHTASDVATRSSFGQPIIHGVHIVLAALQACRNSKGLPSLRPGLISAQLKQPLFIGEVATVDCIGSGRGKTRLRVRIDGITAALITLVDTAPPPQTQAPTFSELTDPPQAPKTRTIDESGEIKGAFNLDCAGSPAELFPDLSAWLGLSLLKAAMRLSAVVGMEWPGGNSLLSGFSLWLHYTPMHRQILFFRVGRTDSRFRLTEIELLAPDFIGRAEAFFRPEPVGVPDFATVQARVDSADFFGHQSLIIGGSRGLGAVSAMLLAAGGGCPLITYHSSPDAALAIAEAIRAAGGDCRTAMLDVTNGGSMLALRDEFSCDSMMYFATPRIFRRPTGRFSKARYGEFSTYYVDAFVDCVEAAMRNRSRKFNVFYPSTMAIEAPVNELTEYIAAKLAGEAICEALARKNSDLHIVVERLPRLLTEQTNSVIKVPAEDSIDAMHAVLRRLVNEP